MNTSSRQVLVLVTLAALAAVVVVRTVSDRASANSDDTGNRQTAGQVLQYKPDAQARDRFRGDLPFRSLAGASGLYQLTSLVEVAARSERANETGVASSANNQHGSQYIAIDSCATTGCHGAPIGAGRANRSSSKSGSSYWIWVTSDPHVHAFDVLLSGRSRRIVQLLGGPAENETPTDPQSIAQLNDPVRYLEFLERRCVSCHATAPPAADTRVGPNHSFSDYADGVNCQSCHGPASQWLDPHKTQDWVDKKLAAENELLGMIDTGNVTRRAEACVGCHVGAPAKAGNPVRDVNHDLIAAGHPRLNFEFAAYLENLPSHWDERPSGKPDPSFADATLWATGQLVAAKAVVEQTAARAKAASTESLGAVWPEFAEYGCYACHHDLQSPSFRQSSPVRVGTLGKYDWGTWNFSLTRLVTGDPQVGSSLAAEMRSGYPTPGDVEQQCATTLEQLAPFTSSLTNAAPDPRKLLSSLAKHDLTHANWDEVAAWYLAVAAVYESFFEQAPPDEMRDKAIRNAIVRLHQSLKFPATDDSQIQYDSPRDFTPETSGENDVGNAVQELQKLLISIAGQ